jgi:ATP/maltotriose-dependent transcriptional regulator MalT
MGCLDVSIRWGAEQRQHHPPAAPPLELTRDRLLDVLRRDAALVTLVWAPAGFGKTSLLSGWVAQSPEARPPG